MIAVIGGGPAGLMAAEQLAAAGHTVTIFDAMPSLGRKFLLAGRSGLNLTHAEEYARFVSRYAPTSPALKAALDAFPPKAVIDFAEELGSACYTGSSGRVFPKHMKASPLLRAWLRRIGDRGVNVRLRHRWTGWTEAGALRFETPGGPVEFGTDATLLALGGASWPRLGSDGGWVPILQSAGVDVTPLTASNCGFNVNWSPLFAGRFAGEPLKSVTAEVDGTRIQGECVVTGSGLEGSLIYAHARALNAALANRGIATLSFDLLPGRSVERIATDLARQDAKQSFANRLRKATGIDGVKAGLVRERLDETTRRDPERLAAALKNLSVTVMSARPIAEAISTAGGISLADIGDDFQLTARPGVFVAGEMLDWDAPTGGYLLTACFATGAAAARGIAEWVGAPDKMPPD